ncbi:hypothetical protein HMPREF0980_02204 [Dorea sp. D27]|nr:hypothetical protein HMPREF0980_02204 [Dorea sp. D27]
MNNTMTIQKTGKQILVFLLFLFLLFFCLMKGKDVGQIVEIAVSASFPSIVLGLLMAGTFHVSEGLNLRILLRAMGHPVSLAQGMKYAYTGFFFSSITPSSTGGQPMQLYMMKKDNIELSHGSLALLMELAGFQAVVFIFEILAAILVPAMGIEMPLSVKVLAVAGFLMNAVFVLFLLTVIFSEKMGKKLSGLAERLIPKIPFIKEEKKQEWIVKTEAGFEEFHACAHMMKRHKKDIVKMLMISTVQIVCWFGVPYMVYLALGYHGVPFLHLFLLQVLVYMAGALLPLPGAMGISEFAFIQLFGGIYSGSSMTAAVLLSRGISFYFLLAWSGLMLILIYAVKKRR